MASYDLESPTTLQQPEYRRLQTDASQQERDMMARLPLMDRRVLRLVDGSEAWTDDAPLVLTVALEPGTGGRDDLIAWYREEHIAMLLEVPAGAAHVCSSRPRAAGRASVRCTSWTPLRCCKRQSCARR